MACGCANRMRKHILPRLGYVQVDGTWFNFHASEPRLQIIKDEEITVHHSELVLKLALMLGKDRFYTWWYNLTNTMIDNIDEHWEGIQTRYREFQDERSKNNSYK